MPSTLVPRAGRVGARVTLHGRQTWLGTHDTAEKAQEAVQVARAGKPKRKPAKRHRPPGMATVGLLADAMPSRMLRAFVLVAAWSGLRLMEVAMLEWPDVEIHGDRALLHVRAGKGHGDGPKEGWSVLFEDGLVALQELSRPHVPRQPILVNQFGNPWTRKSVNHWWVGARATVAGQGETTFHALRKAHATWLLNQGHSDLDVAVQLRHIDRHNRPDPTLVRKIYGFPDLDAALKRIAGTGR